MKNTLFEQNIVNNPVNTMGPDVDGILPEDFVSKINENSKIKFSRLGVNDG
jgi:hypothetical protein